MPLSEQTVRLISDPRMRFAHLYQIKTEDTGQVIPFVPRWHQWEVFDAVYVHNWTKIFILKSRRHGCSTGIDILGADRTWYNPGFQFSIADQNQTDAAEKLKNKVKIAWNGLPDDLKASWKKITDNDSEFTIKMGSTKGKDHAPSIIAAGKNARGGTNNFLHVSEAGPIQYYDAKRAGEIVTGALPSARKGVTIIETTWKGGKGGPIWPLVKQALNTEDRHRNSDDFRLMFFPWWKDAECNAPGPLDQIDRETMAYFENLEQQIGRMLTDSQKVWYFKEKERLGIYIFSEYPSIVEECWNVPVHGAIYAALVAKARQAGRIRPLAEDERELVHLFSDLGAPVTQVTLYVQFIGEEIRIIDCDSGIHETTTQKTARMNSKGFNYGTWFLPHDAGAKQKGGMSYEQELRSQGWQTRIVPKTHDPMIGINRAMQLFHRIHFNSVRCESDEGGSLVDALIHYHMAEDTEGNLKSKPHADWSAHYADSLRTLAEADINNMLPERGSGGPTRRRPRPIGTGRNRMQALTGIGSSGRFRPR